MSKTEKLERIRAARYWLQPMQNHCRGDDKDINEFLNRLAEFEARIQYGSEDVPPR